ncbi:ParB/RepB/Spo0J family partition protein [Crocosphaera sp.]|uniref:ParB/RepB/Spo0J family partition protein n=1 Tax=Crocosphaera sp. TaxID=2729996 RepID=UPI00260C90A8|nr:ParB/RepB/Spo0J family partition protein [Crocosphaera sp.]MDJ0579671.1 ParB/RepB/Spo0J family partition protein [Crocosphaera sp.]
MSKKNKPFQPLGINALFGEELEKEVESPHFIPIELILLPPSQPRRYFDPEKMAQLTDSIRVDGILQPLVVRPYSERKGYYELVFGERRYRSAKQAEFTEVPVIIKELNDSVAQRLALIENLHREDLNPVDEVEGILQFLSLSLEKSVPDVISELNYLKNKKENKVTDNVIRNEHESKILEIFEQLGQNWYSFTCNRLRILNLPDDLLSALREGKIAYTKAKAIAKVKNYDDRQRILSEAIAQQWSQREIVDRVKEILSLASDKSKTPSSPSRQLDDLSKRIKKAKLWENKDLWKKIKTRLKYIEDVLDSLEDEMPN